MLAEGEDGGDNVVRLIIIIFIFKLTFPDLLGFYPICAYLHFLSKLSSICYG